MKRTWFSFLIVAVIIGLLTLFLGLQYKWLSEVSVAERERMQKRVEDDTMRMAEDFNREMHAAYYNFQTDAETWKNADWREFNERYEFWKTRTAYPDLIRDIYFLSSRPDTKPLRYDPDKHVFEPAERTAELEALKPQLTADAARNVYEDAMAMVLPVFKADKHLEHVVLRRSADPDVTSVFKMPERFGWVVVLLNGDVVKNRVLADLSAKYFGADYKLTVRDREGRPVFAPAGDTTANDATAVMFAMSPDKLMFFARDPLPKIVRDRTNSVVVNQRVESHTFSRTEADGKTGTFQLELKKKDGSQSKPRATIVASSTEADTEPWVLGVQHIAGSIDNYVAQGRNRNFAIGLGIYLLLVGGIMAIVISALRSRRFAQRQIDFVSSVSHEFRTPLAVIYSAGENLADGVAKEDAQVSRYGELIKGEGKKLSAMVEQILEFAGANSGKRKYNFAAADVRTIVKEAVDECRPLIESGGFTLETDLQEGIPWIQADRAALSSAVQNLIANSVKYSNGSKWVRISVYNGGASVKIAVEDRGIGIGESDRKLVFEPFYRAKEVVDAQISGNGLGLNLVKKVAEAHGGRVELESRPGSGSKFTIEIPPQK
ncbi:MAG TPA: HAMP domain-containing sensor histidine kinase [Pyrinomonadaceae bacterium]|nr:HAMP domain-containing sensor histidine kinase [Pyrinomonadaceae bacterium]